jgi:hypothetical protein
MEINFKKYVKDDGKNKISVFSALLNGVKINSTFKHTDTRLFELKVVKEMCFVDENVEISKSEIKVPHILELKDFENAFNMYNLYTYTPAEDKFVVNDLGVISPIMCIQKDFVCSAIDIKEHNEIKYGFNYFYHYVVDNLIEVDKWKISYNTTTSYFEIVYDGNIIYYIESVDKMTTYSIVLYFCEKYRSEQELIDKYTLTKYIREDI